MDIHKTIQSLENWKPARKRRYSVYLCKPPVGTKVINKLCGTVYVTTEEKPFVLSGTVGEQWVIDPEKLFKTYQLPTEEPLTLNDTDTFDWIEVVTRTEGIEIEESFTNWVMRVPNNNEFEVNTLYGDKLFANKCGIPHGDGDYLVCATKNGNPDLTDMWVVNGKIFENTYEIKGNLEAITENNHSKKQKTPKPISLFSSPT